MVYFFLLYLQTFVIMLKELEKCQYYGDCMHYLVSYFLCTSRMLEGSQIYILVVHKAIKKLRSAVNHSLATAQVFMMESNSGLWKNLMAELWVLSITSE